MLYVILVITLLTLVGVFGLYSQRRTTVTAFGILDDPNDEDLFDEDWDECDDPDCVLHNAKNPRRVAAGKAIAAKMKRGSNGRFAKKA